MTAFRTFMGGDNVTTGEVHWSAVFAGVIVSLIGQVLLTLLGAGLGAATFDTVGADANADANTVAWGAFAWWAVSGIACAFAGGWTAGWVAGSSPSVDRIEGPFQAFLSWGTATLLVAAIVFGIAAGSAFSTRLGGPLSYANPIRQAEATIDRAANGDAAAQERVTDATAKATLASFFVLIIGAIAAMGGGYLGVANAKRVIARSPGSTTTADVMAGRAVRT